MFIPEQKPQSSRLETRLRNEAQAVLIRMMLGENPPMEAQIVWVEQFGETVSDIIDDPREVEIRALMQEEKFKEAAALIRTRIETTTRHAKG